MKKPICKIEGCGSPVTAKGLCARHYMRTRRHGDAAVLKKRGPAHDAGRAATYAMMKPISPRSFARFWGALRKLERAGATEAAKKQLIAEATSKNGIFSISTFAALTGMVIAEAADRAKSKPTKRKPTSDITVDGRKLKPPLPDCPICSGKGLLSPSRVFSACGAVEYKPMRQPCPCTYAKRRGNPNLYDDLRREREQMEALAKRRHTAKGKR